MLMFDRNQHNVVKLLFSNKNFKRENKEKKLTVSQRVREVAGTVGIVKM